MVVYFGKSIFRQDVALIYFTSREHQEERKKVWNYFSHKYLYSTKPISMNAINCMLTRVSNGLIITLNVAESPLLLQREKDRQAYLQIIQNQIVLGKGGAVVSAETICLAGDVM